MYKIIIVFINTFEKLGFNTITANQKRVILVRRVLDGLLLNVVTLLFFYIQFFNHFLPLEIAPNIIFSFYNCLELINNCVIYYSYSILSIVFFFRV